MNKFFKPISWLKNANVFNIQRFSFKTQNKILKEDENLDNLINQMNSDKLDKILHKQTQKGIFLFK